MLFLLTILLLQNVFALSISDWSLDKESYSPGDSGVVSLYVSFTTSLTANQSLEKFESVSVKLTLFNTTYSDYLGDGYGNLKVTIPFSIPKNLEEGIYPAYVTIEGYAKIKEGDDTDRRYETVKTIIPIKVYEKPRLSLFVSPKVLPSSGNFTIKVCSTKPIKEVFVKSSIYLLDEVYFANITECSEKVVAYDVSPFSGEKDVKFYVDYKTALGDENTETFTIPLSFTRTTTKFFVKEIEIPHKEEKDVTFEIKNKGNDATDVNIYFPDEIITEPSFISIPILKNGETKKIQLKVYTSLQPGKYKLPLKILWKEEGKDREETVYLSIRVVGTERIDVFVEGSPVPLIWGKNATLNIVIANKNDYKIENTYVILNGSGFSVEDVTKEKFVGSIDENDFTMQQFTVKMNDKASNEPKATITVIYTDPSGSTHKFVKTILLNVKEEQKSMNIITSAVGLLIALIIIAVILKKTLLKK